MNCSTSIAYLHIIRISLMVVILSVTTFDGLAQALKLAGKFTGTSSTTIAASAATDTLRLSTNTRIFQQELTLESGQDPVKDLTVSIAPFITPNGSPPYFSLTINKQPGTTKTAIASTETAIVSLTLATPVEGKYKSVISLLYDGKRWSIPVVITRTRLALTLDMPKLAAVHNRIFMSGDVPIPLTITGKADQEVQLFKPVLSFLNQVQANDDSLLASFDVLMIYDERGKPMDSIFTIAPNQTRTVQLIVQGLRQSGKFSGYLSIAGPEVSPIKQKITIYQKEHGILAAFLIGLGVFGSYLLRRYAKTGRPRLLRQRRAALLTVELNEASRVNQDLSKEEMAILQTLRRQINAVYEDTDLFTDDQANLIITEVDHKIDLFPIWGTACRAVAALQPLSLRDSFQSTLKEGERLLQAPQLTDEDLTSLMKMLTELNAIPAKVKDKSKAYLVDQIKRLLEDVTQKKAAIKDTTVHQQLFDLVETKLDRAQNLLSGNTADMEESATKLYNEAGEAYARILTDVLLTSLSSPAPLGFVGADWITLKQGLTANATNVKLATDANQAIKAYEDLYSLYLINLAEKLTEYREKIFNRLTKAELNEETQKPLIEKLNTANVTLETISSKIAEKNFGEASDAYNQAKDLIVTVENTLRGIQGVTLTAPTDSATAPNQTTEAATGSNNAEFYDMPFFSKLLGPSRNRQLSAPALDKKIGLYDLFFTLIVLLVGILSGMLLLWVNNTTWGGFSDHLIAFLWGLGVHQVANNTAEGVVGWAAKLTE